eukprot:gb/GECH01014475.1/.p1 GENE.gb/GECH01014475.1/~~gb/GECH01014475.1/.p1  ORF type:complete len:384 (+),score=94.41 gb/GECH01014475.1/:1-1152(+)
MKLLQKIDSHNNNRNNNNTDNIENKSSTSSSSSILSSSSSHHPHHQPTNSLIIMGREIRPESEREHIIQQLINTENTYVEDLDLVHREFGSYIIRDNLLPRESFAKIFSDIEMIKKANRTFLSEVTNMYDKDGADCLIGTYTMKRMLYFKVYSSYINQYFISREVLENQININSRFSSFLKQQTYEATKKYQKSVDLKQLLYLPIQRMGYYKLIFKSLEKSTSSTHSDFKSLQQATQNIEAIADHCEDQLRKNEGLIRVLHLEKELKMKGLATDSRQLVEEGKLGKVRLNEKGVVPSSIYLFNDMLLCVKTTHLKKRRIEMPFISELRIKIYELRDTSVYQLAFAVQSTQYTFKFVADTPEQRKYWMNRIQQVHDANVQQKSK